MRCIVRDVTDRKQIKFNRKVYEKLEAEKRDYETWDGLAMRLLEGTADE
jgi:hypothetical protein